jgi:hypothetical protein
MKLKLNIEDMTGEFFEDTRLLGLVAPVKDYQFCWQLNNRLRLDFRINNEIEIQLTRRQRKYFFGVYEYLLPEFKHLDFLWLLKGDVVGDEKLQDLLGSIRSVPGVQLVMELVQDKIKNKGHLIF